VLPTAGEGVGARNRKRRNFGSLFFALNDNEEEYHE
jgi:hypothetical protein